MSFTGKIFEIFCDIVTTVTTNVTSVVTESWHLYLSV